MKRLLWTIPALLLGSVSVLAGASSENRIDEKALQGPDGQGAKSTDPNIERSGTPGPKGPSESQKPSYNYNQDPGSSGSAGPAGSGASGTLGMDHNSGSSSSGTTQTAPSEGNNPTP
jgi:hypothetical protein